MLCQQKARGELTLRGVPLILEAAGTQRSGSCQLCLWSAKSSRPAWVHDIKEQKFLVFGLYQPTVERDTWLPFYP